MAPGQMSLFRTFLAETWQAKLRMLHGEMEKLPVATPGDRAAKVERLNQRMRQLAAGQRALRRKLREEGRP